jgi:DNA-binding beta-propeller fold protein YncE
MSKILVTLIPVILSSVALAQKGAAPKFEVDPFWPKMPDKLFIGPVRGLAVDRQDHVWIVEDSTGIANDIKGAAANPPVAECCIPAPQVMEFDAAGNYVQGWNMSGTGFEPLSQVHGIFVDHKDNVWISSEREGDNHLLKFTKSGKFLLQIGHKGKSTGSNDTENVNRAADMYVYPRTNELFVADGYGNRRVIVFDAETGAYKRHWGAYGNKPDDTIKTVRGGQGDGAKTFSLVHHVTISNDDLVYVADRNNNRIQVFTPDGKFVKEAFLARETLSNGTVYSFAFSRDPKQQYLYVADVGNGHIRILNRQTLEPVGAFGRWGRQAGQFMVPHNIATDSKGNLYVAEIREGRVQKFVLK